MMQNSRKLQNLPILLRNPRRLSRFTFCCLFFLDMTYLENSRQKYDEKLKEIAKFTDFFKNSEEVFKFYFFFFVFFKSFFFFCLFKKKMRVSFFCCWLLVDSWICC